MMARINHQNDAQVSRSHWIVILMFASMVYAGSCHAQKSLVIHVSRNGSDSGDGSERKPFHSVERVQRAARESYQAGSNVTIVFSAGIYPFSKTLLFGSQDGRTGSAFVKYKAEDGKKVVFSGGRQLRGTWIKVDSSKSNLWVLNIPEAANFKWQFRALYRGDLRLARASSDTLFTAGPLRKYQNVFSKPYEYRKAQQMIVDSIEAFCGFTYKQNDLDRLKLSPGTEINVYHSWETSWHTVCKLDTGSKEIFFENPATYPVGFFSPVLRYRVENNMGYLRKPGEWCLDPVTGNLYYVASPGENPNSAKFIAPKLEQLIRIYDEANPVTNIIFENIRFQYTNDPTGIHEVTRNTSIPKSNSYPFLDLTKGFSSVQAGLGVGESVLIYNGRNIQFNSCAFTHLGAYAVRIGEYSTGNQIDNCIITDCGSGGILLGLDNKFIRLYMKEGGDRTIFVDRKYTDKVLPASIFPTKNSVSNCEIYDCGKYFASGVGIGLMQASHSTISKNLIHNLPYTGISVGWDYDMQDTHTNDNVITDNEIYDVVRVLADGGGIYTLGKQVRTVYKRNYIHDIGRNKNAAGASNNGFFLDEGSNSFELDSNVVERIQNADLRFNKSDKQKVTLGRNYFQKTGENKDLRQRPVRIQRKAGVSKSSDE